MLTLIGTGHVFNIADPISFVIHRCWPDAVCVELDELRYRALTADKDAVEAELRKRGIDPEAIKKDGDSGSAVFRRNREYQEKIAKENGVNPATDMIVSIGAAKSLGADIFCIDKDVHETLDRMWAEMGTAEKIRYRCSGILDRFGGKKRSDATQAEYYDDESRYLDDFRKKYPAMTRVLIDERNEFMAKKIEEVARSHERTVAVVGDGHIQGLDELMPKDIERRIVRLRDLSDPARVEALKREYWEAE